jgi:hypothetical protein
MPEFEAFARIRFSLEAEDDVEAKSKASKILTHLLDPKGIDVVGFGVRELVHTESVKESEGAKRLLRALSREVFTESVRLSHPRKKTWRGVTIQEWPLSIMVGKNEATGTVVEVPREVQKEPHPGYPEAGIEPDPGEVFDVPEGHYTYGWNARAFFDPEEVGKVARAAREFTKEMVKAITKAGGKVAASVSRADTDPEEDLPLVAVTQGVFTAPLPPEEMMSALRENLGIRSIIPDFNLAQHLENLVRSFIK